MIQLPYVVLQRSMVSEMSVGVNEHGWLC